MAIKISHLTTCHARDEVRVFQKECLSLAAAGYDVHLVVADGKGEAVSQSVHIHDAGRARGRLERMLFLPWRMWRVARKIKARIYHMHEPELLLIALLLKWSGAHVIYDSHEDVARAVLSREWAPIRLRKAISVSYEWFEDFITARIAAVVGATPHIARRFSKVNPRSVVLNNYPLAREVQALTPGGGEGRKVCYMGNISIVRGIFEMVGALEGADAQLILAGPFENAKLEEAVRGLPGWSRVDYRGMVSRQDVLTIMAQSRAGLLLYHPEPNHVDAQPNKMFEYMSAGLPILASNFPLWEECVTEVGAGVCVDALDSAAIARALKALLDNEEGSWAMGMRGRQAVLNRFQWPFEEPKLLTLYEQLVGSTRGHRSTV